MRRFTDRQLNIADTVILAIAVIIALALIGAIIRHSAENTVDIAIQDMFMGILALILLEIVCIRPHMFIAAHLMMNGLDRDRAKWEAKGYLMWNEKGELDYGLIKEYKKPATAKLHTVRTVSLLIMLMGMIAGLMCPIALAEQAVDQPSMLYILLCLTPATVMAVGVFASKLFRTTLTKYLMNASIDAPQGEGSI